jgi:hypothetical protein
MDKIIVYVDDAEHALQQLAPMKPGGLAAQSTQWLLVACAPRLTRHASKWVSRSAREHWRNKWSNELFAQIVPMLKNQGDTVVSLIATLPLVEQTERLLVAHPGARVLDARRVRFGTDMAPVTKDQPASHDSRWTLPGAAVGMGALLVLAAD